VKKNYIVNSKILVAIQPQNLKGTKKHKEKEQISITFDRCNRFWRV